MDLQWRYVCWLPVHSSSPRRSRQRRILRAVGKRVASIIARAKRSFAATDRSARARRTAKAQWEAWGYSAPRRLACSRPRATIVAVGRVRSALVRVADAIASRTVAIKAISAWTKVRLRRLQVFAWPANKPYGAHGPDILNTAALSCTSRNPL